MQRCYNLPFTIYKSQPVQQYENFQFDCILIIDTNPATSNQQRKGTRHSISNQRKAQVVCNIQNPEKYTYKNSFIASEKWKWNGE